jgi:dolichol-phosphate mannosyltransferase
MSLESVRQSQPASRTTDLHLKETNAKMTTGIVPQPPLTPNVDLERFRGALAVVLLPTLNEEKGLERTLLDLPIDRFRASGQKIQPLIIDGGSTDGTLDVARRWDLPVLRQTSRGKGAAVIEAITWVHQRGVPFVVVLDADATYPPDRILPTLDLLRGGTDLVVGVRRPVWGPPSDLKDLVHRVGNLVMSYSSSLLSGRTILDLCSGFWGVSTERFMELGLDDTSFAIEAELILKSIRRGFSVHQIPVYYQERLGQAKLHAVHDGGQILLAIFQHARRAPPPTDTWSTSAPWGRDLLSIGLTVGIAGAVVECNPSQAVEAGQIARFLQRNLPQTRVDMGGPVAPEPWSKDSPGLAPPGDSDRSPPENSPLVVSLPSTLPAGDEARSVTVSIRSHRRQLTIELPSNEPAAAPTVPEAPSPPWARAGGWMMAQLPHRVRFPSLLVVTSRLNFEPERQQQTLLSANGFHVVEHPRERREDPHSQVLDVVAPAA